MDAMCSNGEFRGREPNSLHAIGGNRHAFCAAKENVKSRFASRADIRVFLTRSFGTATSSAPTALLNGRTGERRSVACVVAFRYRELVRVKVLRSRPAQAESVTLTDSA